MNTAGCSLFPPSSVDAFTTSCTEIDRAVGNCDAEGGADGSRHQTDFTAMRAHEFCGNGQTQPSAPGARRALKSLEHMSTRFFRYARPGIRQLDNHHATFAPPSNANLIARPVARAPGLHRLYPLARDINDDAQQLLMTHP